MILLCLFACLIFLPGLLSTALFFLNNKLRNQNALNVTQIINIRNTNAKNEIK